MSSPLKAIMMRVSSPCDGSGPTDTIGVELSLDDLLRGGLMMRENLDNQHIRHPRCGTGALCKLYDAKKAFHSGLPVSDDIIIDEVQITIFDDWRKVGELYPVNGPKEDVITPRISVEGAPDDNLMLDIDEIDGFIPKRGHEYVLLARRFRLKSWESYRLLEFLSLVSEK